MIVFLLLLSMVIIYFLAIIQIRYEKKMWNKGKCPKCASEWKLSWVDSQNGRYYECPNNCKTWAIITYNIEEK